VLVSSVFGVFGWRNDKDILISIKNQEKIQLSEIDILVVVLKNFDVLF
jgi:hypothetical protein